jgi:membrane-associated phospholipid phosphatase
MPARKVDPVQNDSVAQIEYKVRPAKYAGIALACAVILVCSFFCDRSVEQFVLQHRNPGLLHVARELSRYGEWFYLLLPALLLLVAGDLWKNRRWMTLGLALTLSSGIAGLSATAIRFSTGRTRPSATVSQGWYGIRHDGQWLPGRSQYNSFPSGHMGFATGFGVALFLGTRRWKIPAVLIPAAIGWSRIYLGAHHFSDVVASAMLGVAVGIYTWYRLVPRLLKN